MSGPRHEIPLRNEVRFWIRRVVVAGGASAFGIAFYLGNLGNYLETQWALRGLAGNVNEARFYVSDMVMFGLLGAGVSIGLWLLRQPKGAHVVWDDDAITETDGDGVRACIPWAQAKQQRVEVTEVRKGRRSAGGGVVQISDDAGRRITVNGSSATWGWTVTRLMQSHVDLTGLWTRAGQLPPGLPFGPDPWSLVRPPSAIWKWLTFFAAGAITIGLTLLAREREAPLPIAGGALVFSFTTMMVPFREWWRLRDPAGAERLPSLDGCDRWGLVHPDALLSTRTGGVWVVKKDGKVVAAETDGIRAARKARALAVLLEVVVRVAIVGALVALLVAQDLHLRKHRGY